MKNNKNKILMISYFVLAVICMTLYMMHTFEGTLHSMMLGMSSCFLFLAIVVYGKDKKDNKK